MKDMVIDDIIKYVLIIFDECQKIWQIDYVQLGKLISKYNLASLLINHFEYFNSMGNQGVVEELNEHIREQGGLI